MSRLMWLLRVRLVSERTAMRVAAYIMWAVALFLMFLGPWKLFRLGLGEKDLLFGMLLVVNLVMLLTLGGIVLDLAGRFAPWPSQD